MRYYSLEIRNAAGQMLQVEKSGLGFAWSDANQGATFSSTWTPWQTTSRQLVGQPNPSALNIYADLPVAPYHTPQGGSFVRIWGLGLQCLGQASDLNPVDNVFKTFVLRAGMSKGLPLANPNQAGIVAQGLIYQAFGNWTGTEQTLDLILMPGSGPTNSDVPISWNWARGQSLQSALQQMMTQAFPTYTANINISANLIAPSDQHGVYVSIAAFAKWLNAYTRKLGAQTNGSGYTGVMIAPFGTGIYAWDGAGPVKPKTVALQFQDLIGQPSWLEANTVLFQTTLRGDINWNDRVTFPTGVMPPFALTTPAAVYPNSPTASKSAFQGTFIVNKELHHYANFRQDDAESWNTTFVCSYIKP